MEPTPSASFNYVVRPASEKDLGSINDIYNHYVATSTCSYQEELETAESRAIWFRKHGPRYPVFVAEQQTRVIAWGSLSPYHVRSAYRFTVENSIYVHPQHQRRGIGSRMLLELISAARTLGYRAIIAAIDSAQTGSVALHARHGFQPVGHFRQVGMKFGRWLDVVYLEFLLCESDTHEGSDPPQKACPERKSVGLN